MMIEADGGMTGRESRFDFEMVLFLHNRYRTTGGEERVVEDLLWLVREHMGEPAELFARDSATLGRRRAAAALLRGGLAPERPRQPPRGGRLWRLAGAVAASPRGTGRRRDRPQCIRSRAPSGSGSAAALGSRPRDGSSGSDVGDPSDAPATRRALCARGLAAGAREGGRRRDRCLPDRVDAAGGGRGGARGGRVAG